MNLLITGFPPGRGSLGIESTDNRVSPGRGSLGNESTDNRVSPRKRKFG